MTDSYQLVIDGALTDAATGETFDSIDPSTGETFAAVAQGGQDDADAALRAARRAFDEGPWPRLRAASGAATCCDWRRPGTRPRRDGSPRSGDAGHTSRIAKGAASTSLFP